MEDRYLFKAKRLDNGEWVIGNLIQNPFFKEARSWISSEQEDKTRLRSISRTQALWNSIEVDSSTICQCTGLKEKNGKLICERIYSFSDAKKELWLQFATKEDYAKAEQQMYDLLRMSEGKDEVVIYISGIKAVKRLPANWNVSVDSLDLEQFYRIFGEKNVKVVEKAIENGAKRD